MTQLNTTIETMDRHRCHPNAGGYTTEVSDSNGSYSVYVCGECGERTPIDN